MTPGLRAPKIRPHSSLEDSTVIELFLITPPPSSHTHTHTTTAPPPPVQMRPVRSLGLLTLVHHRGARGRRRGAAAGLSVSSDRDTANDSSKRAHRTSSRRNTGVCLFRDGGVECVWGSPVESKHPTGTSAAVLRWVKSPVRPGEEAAAWLSFPPAGRSPCPGSVPGGMRSGGRGLRGGGCSPR